MLLRQSPLRRPATSTRWAWRAAAVAVGGLLALGGTGIAAAETAVIHGTPGSLDSNDEAVNVINDKGGHQIRANRLFINVNGKKVIAYCIDLHTPLGIGLDYQEGPWNTANVGSDLKKIQWILNHGWPAKSIDALVAAAGASKPAGVGATQLERLVYAATQSAVWRYSDPDDFALRESPEGFNLDPVQYAFIVKLYKYLVSNATDQPEPAPKLTIDPATKTGEAGKKIGPFTITSGGGEATLTATGGKLVDKDGNPVTKLPNGGQFYVQSDTAGTVNVHASGSGQVPIGRVFTFVKQAEKKQQKLILADVAGAPLEADATVTVTPPVPGLPVTGFKVTGAVMAGLLLLGGGVLLVTNVRRRRVRFTA